MSASTVACVAGARKGKGEGKSGAFLAPATQATSTVANVNCNFTPLRTKEISEQENDHRSYIRNLSSCEKKT